MTELARIIGERRDTLALVSVDGEVDASNVEELRAAVRAQLTNRSTALVIDLCGTDYLDSAGINLLFALDAELRDRQQRLHLVVDPASPIARMLEISGLTSVVANHPDRDAALAAAGAPG